MRDTNWLIARAALPTANWLIRFGMQVDPFCHCGQSEYLVQLFVECQLAKRLVAWYQSWVHCAQSRMTRPTPFQILVGYNESFHIPPVFPFLLGIICHQIWVARNGFRFDKSPVTYGDIPSHVKSSLRFTLRIQLHHCPWDRFSELWLASNALGFVSEENISSFQRRSGGCFTLCCPVTCSLESTGVTLIGSYCRSNPSMYVCKYCCCYTMS